jgi:membrane protein required for colicin V production
MIFVLLILLFVIRCYLKGFVSEVFSVAAVVLGLLASLFFYRNGGEFLRAQLWHDMKVIPEVVVFIALFLIVFIVIKFLEKVLNDIIYRIKLGRVDRFLGIILGFVEGIVVVSLVLFILRIQPLFDSSEILSDSFFARILLSLLGQEKILGV